MVDKTTYEKALEALLSQEELENEIATKIDQFQGLLTREAAIKLIAKEKGLLKQEQRVCKINDIPKSGRKISFVARILRILPIIKYHNGKVSRTVVLSDNTGRIKLKLWAADLELFSRFKIGDLVEVKNAYERNGELGLGYSGEIKIIKPSPFSALSSLTPSTYVNIKAKVTKVEGKKSYNKNDNLHFVFSISDGSAEKQCVIWEGIGRGTMIKAGDEVILENAYVKAEGIYIYRSGRILLRPGSGAKTIGKIENIECERGQIKITLNGKVIMLDRKKALDVLGVDVADDISLESIVNLKKEVLLNKNISL